MELILILLIYFFGINVLAYIIYTYDKKQAIKHKYRVSEQFLLLLVVGGGMFGAILSMVINRHKIKKTTFIIKYIIAIVLFIYLLTEYNQLIITYINNLIVLIH